MGLETTEEELMHTIFPHPTLSEMMHESVLDAYDRAIHIWVTMTNSSLTDQEVAFYRENGFIIPREFRLSDDNLDEFSFLLMTG